MLSGMESLHNQVKMSSHGGSDDNGIDIRISEELAIISCYFDPRITCLHVRELLGPQIANRRHFRTWGFRKIANQVRTPVTIAYNTDSDHRFFSCCFVSPTNLAGTPATIPLLGTLWVTTAPAPTKACSPIVTPHMISAPLPMEAPRL